MSRKNHKMVDGRLLQIDKKYSNLKMAQKEKINRWLRDELRRFYRENGRMPRKEEFDIVIEYLYDRIEAADIWIPYEEIVKRFRGKCPGIAGKLLGQIQKEERLMEKTAIHIIPLDTEMSVCKVIDYSGIDLTWNFCFVEKTDEENSLVCQTAYVPENTTEREDGWKMFRIQGTLDFGMIGILSGISAVLAGKGIGIFAISTYNTDYILVKTDDFEAAIEALKNKGYSIESV